MHSHMNVKLSLRMRFFVSRRPISTHAHLDISGASFNSCGDPLITLSILGHQTATATQVILHNPMRNNQRTSNIVIWEIK